MKYARSLPLVIATAGLFTLAITVARHSAKVHAQSTNGQAEFSSDILIKYFDANNALVRTEKDSYARRADGSIVKTLVTVNGAPGNMMLISDTRNAVRVTVDFMGNSKTTYKLNTEEIRALESTASCTGDGPAENIVGHVAFRKISEIKHGQTVINEEKWLAPDLACFPLRRSYSKSFGGKLQGTTVEQVTSLSVSAPNLNLFEIPANLTERTPSQAMAARAAAKGIRCNGCDQAKQSLDKVYAGRQHF